MSATAGDASSATMRVKRIAHDESHGSNPNQTITAFRQNGRQSDFPAADMSWPRSGVSGNSCVRFSASTGIDCARANTARVHVSQFSPTRLLRNENCAEP